MSAAAPPAPPPRVGISGWRYPPWRGVFYPEGLPQRAELEYVSTRLSTVELNGSFYSLQRPASYQAWAAQTPDDFVFAVKGGRFVTHMKKLRDVETPLANFFASGVLALGPKLGPVLWQLPPSMSFDGDRVAEFLALLPHDTEAAVRLAGRHDERMAGRSWLVTDAPRPVEHAMEVRHASFRDPAFATMLAEHDVALVTADTAGRWPFFDRPTSRLVYVRLHGDVELYVSGYSDEALAGWADRVRGWRSAGHHVHVYFDNDVKVHAPFDAMRLAAMLDEDRARAGG